jgi:hypothetical protein
MSVYFDKKWWMRRKSLETKMSPSRLFFELNKTKNCLLLQDCNFFFLYTILLLGFISTQCLIDMIPITD